MFPIANQTLLARNIFNVALILLIAILVNQLLRSFVRVPKGFDNRRTQTYASIIRNIITILVYAVALHVVFIIFGINITPLLASAGIIGIALGFGARPLIEDLIAGIFLLSQASIAIGDYVKLDDIEGYIESIGFRTLTIRTDEGALSIIPNGQIKKVINFSRHRANVIIDIPVKADSNVDAVLKVLKESLSALEKDTDLSSSLFPDSIVNGLEDIKPAGPMMIRTTIVTHSSLRWEVARKFRYLVKKGFEKNKLAFG